MGGAVVLALDPGPQGAVERLKALGGGGGEVGEHRSAKGTEEAFDFSLSRGLVGAGVDERDAELCAHERELVGAVVGTIVDEQPHGQSAPGDGLLEHGQERGGVLGVGEGGEGNHPGGVVDAMPISALHRSCRHPDYAAPVARTLAGMDHRARNVGIIRDI